MNKKIEDKEFSDENINFSPEIIQIKNNEIPNLFTFRNFEILSKEIVELFQKEDNIIYEKNFSECIIIDNYIIINLPKNLNGNDKYMTIVGRLDDFIFNVEYILIYDDELDQNRHINNIKNNLVDFLNRYNSFDIFEPFLDDENPNSNAIGSIIKYNTNNNTNNYNNNIIEKEKDTINNDLHLQFKDKENNDKNNNQIYNNNKNLINEEEYNLNYITNSKFIRDNYPFPPLIGLQNIGATCYMNATLQCFCHIEMFVNHFKYSEEIIDKVKSNKNNLTASFKLLIEKLWPNDYDPSYNTQKYYAPEEFKEKISEMNPLFKGIAANDSKDLVNFIIMTLHEELNKHNNSKVNNNNMILDQRNQALMFQSFQNNFVCSNQSIISDLFYAINCNITQCGGCGEKTFNYQTYFFIVFPLEEVRKFKNNINQFNCFNNNNLNNNVVDIYDCFNHEQKINQMSGDNSMYCNFCRQTCVSSMCTILTTGPEILILLLNRGKGIEFNVKINFYEDLNLFNYIQNKNEGYNYKLIGVISHIGESGMGGHFIAYCRHPIINQWHKYNDAIVTEVNDFQNEVIIFGMPYLLFYQKVK